MNYFIIHSGSDYKAVEALINVWSTEHPKSKFALLKGTKSDWYDDARARIRAAQKIIYIVGESSSKSENIDWELNTAFSEGKDIYVYKLKKEYNLNKLILALH